MLLFAEILPCCLGKGQA